jgi:Carbohydrate family 9 binding domain-like/PEP-CTERM motif
MVSRLHLAVGIGCALLCQSASAQPAAQIKKTSTPPVIDGNGSDAAWANANVYGTSTFFDLRTRTLAAPSPDLTLEWRALWDDTNFYVMSKATDDAIVNSLQAFGGPDSGNWEDDCIEFYIDAQDVNNLEYNPSSVGTAEPTYEFIALAGWTPAIANDATITVNPRRFRTPSTLPNTSFAWGINSYDGNDVNTRYPQTMGSATSGPVTANPAGGFDWTFEAAFPWEALEETPADILARGGIFGFGVAYSDDDNRGTRDVQYMWATSRDDLWHRSRSMPDVQLVGAVVPEPATLVLVALAVVAALARCQRR